MDTVMDTKYGKKQDGVGPLVTDHPHAESIPFQN